MSTVSGIRVAPNIVSICNRLSMNWLIVALEAASHCLARAGSSSVEMPMILKWRAGSSHASLSREAISSLQGPHQLAQTLMISGLPRNSDSFRGGPLSPCRVASRTVSPIPTSPGDFAAVCGCGNAPNAHSKSTGTIGFVTTGTDRLP